MTSHVLCCILSIVFFWGGGGWGSSLSQTEKNIAHPLLDHSLSPQASCPPKFQKIRISFLSILIIF